MGHFIYLRNLRVEALRDRVERRPPFFLKSEPRAAKPFVATAGAAGAAGAAGKAGEAAAAVAGATGAAAVFAFFAIKELAAKPSKGLFAVRPFMSFALAAFFKTEVLPVKAL
jgi:hypothetical protein